MKQSSPIAINQDQNKPNNIELPHNLEAEQQLLGALIKNNELSNAIEIQDSIASHKIFNSILYS